MPIDTEGDGSVPGHGVESVSCGVSRAASAVTRLAMSFADQAHAFDVVDDPAIPGDPSSATDKS